MKIFWMSDSPTAPSGFGNVTRAVCAGLAELGHDVSILGWQAHGSPTIWRNCALYPLRFDAFGADVLLQYLRRIQPDVLVTLADVWWLSYITDPAVSGFLRTAAIPWALYYPVDGDMGGGRLPQSWVHILQLVDLPIAMSAYGRDVTRANGVSPAYIPHGVDTTVFRPAEDRAAARQRFGYDGRFVVLCDARNQPRKLLPRALDIFRRFAEGKDDVVLHLHCDPKDPASRSPEYHYDLEADIAFLGLTDRVRLSPEMSIEQGLPLSQLAAIYQASDVHLLTSWGEGFGLPTLQAAAAGVVPLASDYTASRELVLGHGEALAVRHFIPDQFGLRRALVDIDDAVTRLERLYADRELLCARSSQSRQFATAYDWKQIVPQWHALLCGEVPRLRHKRRYADDVRRVVLGGPGYSGPADLAGVLRNVLAPVPDGARVTLSVSESKIGQLAGEILRDATTGTFPLTVPVTLPPVNTRAIARRLVGCVYLASDADVRAFRVLRRVFPGLAAWSQAALDITPDERLQLRTVDPRAQNSAGFERLLAATTLALDLGCAQPSLSTRAAEAGVPCVGLEANPDQLRLWPELSLVRSDFGAAASLGRWMLSDQGAAEELCTRARQRTAASPALALAGARSL